MTDTLESTQVATNTSIYESAYAAFVPAADDAIENVPFYRAWAGLKAVLAAHGHSDPYRSGIDAHGICCWAHDGSYKSVINVLDMHMPKTPKMRDRMLRFYHSEPSIPTECDAQRIFKDQYKSKFPGNRLNSTHAKKMRDKVKSQAMVMAKEDYDRRKIEHDAAVAKEGAAEKKHQDEYNAMVAQYQAAVDLIQKLKQE